MQDSDDTSGNHGFAHAGVSTGYKKTPRHIVSSL